MKNRLIFALLALVLIIAGGFLIRGATYTPESPSPTKAPTSTPISIAVPSPIISVDPNEPPKEMTLEGEYLCLPHVNANGPQTMECALGMKLIDGTYIALDMGNLLNSDESMKFNTGSTIRVTGLYVPVEQLNTDMWQKYPIKGIMKVAHTEKL